MVVDLYGVHASDCEVTAWSTARLPHEPKGWLKDYRHELQAAVRAMRPTPTSHLVAEYSAPEAAFVDLENVLLYNVGSGCYSHLTTQGLLCRRTQSKDARHRVNYCVAEPLEWPESAGRLLAEATLREAVFPSTAVAWWYAFRSHLKVDSDAEHRGEIALSVEFGSAWRGRGVASAVKELLDGLVMALHVHDGTLAEHIPLALAKVGDGPELWELLNEPSAAILGRRQLVHRRGTGITVNPADERCASFRLVRQSDLTAPLRATVFAFAQRPLRPASRTVLPSSSTSRRPRTRPPAAGPRIPSPPSGSSRWEVGGADVQRSVGP